MSTTSRKVQRALRVGRVGHARYVTVGRILPFLEKDDLVLADATITYNDSGKPISFSVTLTWLRSDNPKFNELAKIYRVTKFLKSQKTHTSKGHAQSRRST